MRRLTQRRGFSPVRTLLVASLLAVVGLLFWNSSARAVSPNDVVRVEEDWALVVGHPEPTTAAPQVTSVISPVGHLDSWHVAFELNHQTLPDYTPGGLCLQLWRGSESQGADRHRHGEVLMQDEGEEITWTQSMSLSDGLLTFEVSHGESVTWGNFGGGGQLRLSVQTSLDNLDEYRPEVSVENSGVGYASNRVHSFTLKRVRVHRANGEVQEVNADLKVHELE